MWTPCGHHHPMQQQGSLLSRSDVMDTGLGSYAHTQEALLGGWTAPAPKFTATQWLQSGLKGSRCPLNLFSSSLLKTGLQLPLLTPLNSV
ncbi:hypothetical protein HPG69_017113 [Diceros bicornis minor]|uniref:Uncharacterized protein n=1 Tax=Diceros bicornis minor TaxID=77932 RepID=A0A7J7ECF6_DICBM|nr:hypothetical protein HPG69_017113 [Diceros bicornis minor]